jgi:hypothetical protein
MTNTIREAIRVLSRTGWTKDAFTDGGRRHCLQGALYEAYGQCPFDSRQLNTRLSAEMADDVRLVNEVIEAQYPERTGGVGVSRFNDHPDTTLEDVVLVMEKAALRKDERV